MSHIPLSSAQMLKQYQDKNIKLADGMEIKKVSNYVIDVFRGDGFDTHSRYNRIKGRWVHVRGQELTANELNQAVQAL